MPCRASRGVKWEQSERGGQWEQAVSYQEGEVAPDPVGGSDWLI